MPIRAAVGYVRADRPTNIWKRPRTGAQNMPLGKYLEPAGGVGIENSDTLALWFVICSRLARKRDGREVMRLEAITGTNGKASPWSWGWRPTWDAVEFTCATRTRGNREMGSWVPRALSRERRSDARCVVPPVV